MMRTLLSKLNRQLFIGLCLAGLIGGVQAQDSQVFSFKVMLDEREIGFHRFQIDQFENLQTVDIQANFKVTFLKIPLYRYGHRNQEVWRDGCLQSMDSQTNDNGERYSVTGQREAEGFRLTMQKDQIDLEQSCVMSFAYWDMQMLEQERLLNAQNGEYMAVKIEFEGNESLQLNGAPVDAIRYRLSSPEHDVDISVWYEQASRRWLSLESRTQDDRKIRYWPIRMDVALQSTFDFETKNNTNKGSKR